jgi:phosphopantothenoylcysteine decarboxylase / phosphopantothenate---cysteine ligase
MKILITAGPTREAIDPVRYLGNRSSGKMGAALAQSAVNSNHSVTLILGPVSIPFPQTNRIDIESARDMQAAVMREFPAHDLLIMAAAVADYRPKTVSPTKLSRSTGQLTLELEPTEDIAASAANIRQPHQRIIGFSLERDGDIERARQKLLTKKLDLIVFNPLATMNSETVEAILLYPDGRTDKVPYGSKAHFADILLDRGAALFK